MGTLVNRLGGFVVSFLALYLTRERGLPIEDAGMVVGLYGAGSIFAGPIGGLSADRLGRRTTMVAGLLLGAMAMIALCHARERSHVAVATFALGLLGDLYRPAMSAATADLVPEHDRARAYGLMHWAVNLGFAIAPVLAGLLAEKNFELLFYGDALTTVVFAGIIWFRVPETRPRRPMEEARGGGEARGAGATVLGARRGGVRSIGVDFVTPFRDPILVAFAGLVFMVVVVFHQSIVTLPLDMRAHGISSSEFGSLIALNGLCIILIQPFAVGQLHRFPRSMVLAASALLSGVGFFVNVWASGPWLYGVAIVIWTLGEITMAPVAPTFVAALAPRDLRGSYQGAFQMAYGGGTFVGPIVGSRILGGLGATWLWTACLGLGLASALGHLTMVGPVRRRLAEARNER